MKLTNIEIAVKLNTELIATKKIIAGLKACNNEHSLSYYPYSGCTISDSEDSKVNVTARMAKLGKSAYSLTKALLINTYEDHRNLVEQEIADLD